MDFVNQMDNVSVTEEILALIALNPVLQTVPKMDFVLMENVFIIKFHLILLNVYQAYVSKDIWELIVDIQLHAKKIAMEMDNASKENVFVWMDLKEKVAKKKVHAKMIVLITEHAQMKNVNAILDLKLNNIKNF